MNFRIFLLSCGLTVFEKLVVVVGQGVSLFVAGLLVEQLGFEEVGHLRGACLIEVAVQAEVLFCLFLAARATIWRASSTSFWAFCMRIISSWELSANCSCAFSCSIFLRLMA